MLRRLRISTFSTIVILLAWPAFVHAQTIVNLGKPTPNAQNQITVPVQTAIAALPATSATCTANPPSGGTGQYAVAFTASPDHNVIEHTVAKVSGYDLVITAPTSSQPCYTAIVRAIGPGGTEPSIASPPFVLRPGTPAAPGSAPAIIRQ